MNVIPFEPRHIGMMRVQTRQVMEVSSLTLPYLAQLTLAGPALSAEHDGQILACAGIASPGFGIGTLWACVSQDAGPHFVRLHKCMRRMLDIPRLRRIEASAEKDFFEGCRWLELLGFKSEGPLAHYGPNGEDHIRYALTRWPLQPFP